MGRTYDTVDDDLAGWLHARPVFFVGTAPSGPGGHVNVSPMGYVNVSPMGYDNVSPMGYDNVSPMGYDNVSPMGYDTLAKPADVARAAER